MHASEHRAGQFGSAESYRAALTAFASPDEAPYAAAPTSLNPQKNCRWPAGNAAAGEAMPALAAGMLAALEEDEATRLQERHIVSVVSGAAGAGAAAAALSARSSATSFPRRRFSTASCSHQRVRYSQSTSVCLSLVRARRFWNHTSTCRGRSPTRFASATFCFCIIGG
uniref:Uncharacterized protein n=1 Tax=Arundo donax TaxID=35708 RepID=A0A0A9GDL8_ARUDO